MLLALLALPCKRLGSFMVVVRLGAPLDPHVEVVRPVLLPEITPTTVLVIHNVGAVLVCLEDHAVPALDQPANARQHFISSQTSAHLELRHGVHAVRVDHMNVLLPTFVISSAALAAAELYVVPDAVVWISG